MIRKLVSGVTMSRRAWLNAGAAFVVLLVVAGILAGPIRSRVRRADERIVDLEKLMARNLRVLSPSSKDVVLRDYRQYGDALRKKGSTAEESAAMLAEIEMLASQGGIVLTTTKPQEPRIETDSEQYTVVLEFEAGIKQSLVFLYAVENSTQMLRVDRLVLDGKGGKTGGVLKASVTLSRVVTL